MRAGIIVEGKSDAAVITNILKGILNISKSDIQYLVPEFDYDETSLYEMREQQFSNWTIVKQNCLNKEKLSDFIDTFEDERFVVIHIDTDVRNEVGFDVNEPSELKNSDDIIKLRQNIKNKITEWLDNFHTEKIAFAIAIQEIDAWILTSFDKGKKDTGLYLNAKERLKKALNQPNLLSDKSRKKIFSLNHDKYKQYDLLSNDFRNGKKLSKILDKNVGLRLFCEELSKFEI